MQVEDKVAVVVPTIREEQFKEFIESWRDEFEKHKVWLIVCEDNPTKTFKTPRIKNCKVSHYAWKEIDKELGRFKFVIPRRSDTIRSFGFYLAYKNDMDVLTLDDDVRPFNKTPYLIDAYQSVRVGASQYFNVGDLVMPQEFMRGYPFKDRERHKPFVQYGMWSGVADLDGYTQIASEGQRYTLPGVDYITVPKGCAVTGCIMNCYISHSAIPYMYQLLMGKRQDGSPLPYDRWGDIWSGLFMKRWADSFNQSVVINVRASVRHERASNAVNNFKKEFNGYTINEDIWEGLSRLSWEFVESSPYFRELHGAYKAWRELLLLHDTKKTYRGQKK